MNKFVSWLLIACLVPYLSGCLTERLWGGDYQIDRHWATADPKLSLFNNAKKNDVLVLYDEGRDQDALVTRRAFYLLANHGKVNAGRMPDFTDVQEALKLPAIPIENQSPGAVTNLSLEISKGMHAIVAEDKHHFTIISDGTEIGDFQLPAYLDREQQLRRMALTPLAVAGDVLICAAAAALVIGLIYAEGTAHSNAN